MQVNESCGVGGISIRIVGEKSPLHSRQTALIVSLVDGRQTRSNSVPSCLPVIRPQAAESLQIGPFHVRVVGLPWLAPSQTPQSARREDEGEAPEPAERPECPDEEEAAGGLGDLAVMCPPHV